MNSAVNIAHRLIQLWENGADQPGSYGWDEYVVLYDRLSNITGSPRPMIVVAWGILEDAKGDA